MSNAIVDEKDDQVCFDVALDKPGASTVTVNHATADGTAPAGSNYDAQGAQLLSLFPGEVAKTVMVSLLGDAPAKPGEFFDLVFRHRSETRLR